MPPDIIIAYLIFIDLIHVLTKAELLTRELPRQYIALPILIDPFLSP